MNQGAALEIAAGPVGVRGGRRMDVVDRPHDGGGPALREPVLRSADHRASGLITGSGPGP